MFYLWTTFFKLNRFCVIFFDTYITISLRYRIVPDKVALNESFRNNWSYSFFVEHPELYLPFLERDRSKASKEALQLDKLINKYGIPHDSKILDYSCGIGRHAIHLANLGYEVVGYDPSPAYIEIAQQSVRNSVGKKNIRFYNGDPSQASKILGENQDGGFDVIILMSSTIGYISEKEDVEILKDAFHLAKNGGVLIIESENRDHTIKNFRPYLSYDFENLQVFEEWSFDFETSIAEGKCKYFKKKDYKSLEYLLEIETTLRLYSLHELIKLINTSGWKYHKCYGNIMTIDDPNFDSEDIVTVCKK